MKKVVGIFERVSFPEFGIRDVTAKVDTGAYSGSLHCTKIKEVLTNTGKELHFSPFDHPEVSYVSRDFVSGSVRSSNGHVSTRYFINTLVEVNEVEYPVRITLSDRTKMKVPVLLGRRFLEENNFLVDVTKDNR